VKPAAAKRKTQNPKRKTQNAKRKTQNAKRKTQNAKRKTQNPEAFSRAFALPPKNFENFRKISSFPPFFLLAIAFAIAIAIAFAFAIAIAISVCFCASQAFLRLQPERLPLLSVSLTPLNKTQASEAPLHLNCR
jgi:hypothetical protein